VSIVAAGIVAPLAYLAVGPQQAEASHGNLNVHVHDDYYHPAGAFAISSVTDHNLARAACEVGDPPLSCDAIIHVGDTITWVSPAPLAVNPHTVTECTDNTFAVCGAGVSAANPIEDSGLRAPPSPGPSGWPYVVQFNTAGTYHYVCTVHPNVMRGRILVIEESNPSVGGVVTFDGSTEAASPAAAPSDGDGGTLTTALVASLAVAAMLSVAATGFALVRARAR
jgi:plastocyanin